MDQLKRNKKNIWEEIEELAKRPITPEIGESLIKRKMIYDILCEVSDHHKKKHGEVTTIAIPLFGRQMAMDWTAGMVNADGTMGPHWSMEDTTKLHQQYKLDCSKEEFWAVMNSLYSDYCEALRESGISTPEVYVRLAKAWIKDPDAVKDKAGAYYTYIVKH